MEVWLIIIGIVVVCFAILMYLHKIRMPAFEGFGAMDDAMEFGAAQDTYFHDLAPTEKGFFVNSNLNLSDLNTSLAQPELYLPMSPDRDYTTYFAPDPSTTYKSVDTFCRTATAPSDLPAHAGGLVECGWYYLDDPSQPSMGLAGTKDAPLFADDIPQNGTWIWDLTLAQQKEEMKKCKRLTRCFLVDLDDFKGKCGFCLTKGYGVPIYPSGQEKYLDANGNFCGQPLVTEGTQCVQTVAPSVKTASGLSCGSYGYASANNEQRMYSKSDCTALNGAYQEPGICTAQDGSTYNSECSRLNMPRILFEQVTQNEGGGSTIPQVCTPNINGNLTPQCLITVAKNLGFADTGSMLRILSTMGAPSVNDNIAIQTLANAGITIPPAIFGPGNIDYLTAGNIFNSIYAAMTSGSPRISSSATLLVNGNVNFDPCDPTFIGSDPIPTQCLQQEFRKAGCQASGSAYPTEATAPLINTLPIETVGASYKELYNTMTTANNPALQADAVKKCLGIQYS